MTIENTFRIAICDDNEEDRAVLLRMTEELLLAESIVYSVQTYSTPTDLLSDIRDGVQYHVLLLDVMMDAMDGMTLAEQLREREDKTQIVFISSNREMALRGYEVNAVRFLAKPAAQDKLREALLCCHRTFWAKREIAIPTSRGRRRTPLSDIIYVEAFDRGTRFVLANEVLETKLKHSDIEKMLPKTDFLLCHRGFIVNLAWTTYIRHYEFTLKNGNTVPIGKGRYAECQKLFLQYITD